MDRRTYLEDKIMRCGDSVMWEMCVRTKVPTCCLGFKCTVVAFTEEQVWGGGRIEG